MLKFKRKFRRLKVNSKCFLEHPVRKYVQSSFNAIAHAQLTTKECVKLCVIIVTLPPSCAVVMKSGNLNFLEPSGLLQACNGIVLSLPYYFLETVQSASILIFQSN